MANHSDLLLLLLLLLLGDRRSRPCIAARDVTGMSSGVFLVLASYSSKSLVPNSLEDAGLVAVLQQNTLLVVRSRAEQDQ